MAWIPPSQLEIDEQLDQAHEAVDRGSTRLAQSYEEGVIAAIEWMLRETEIKPMDEEE